MSKLEQLVTIKLDRKRTLRLTLKGMIAFEKRTGKSLLKNIKFEDFSLEDTAAIIWVCLIHEDDALTFDDVANMLDFNNITPMMDAVTKCLIQSMPPPEAPSSRPLVKKSRRG